MASLKTGISSACPAVLRWENHLEATKGQLSHRHLGLYSEPEVLQLCDVSPKRVKQFPAPLIMGVTNGVDVELGTTVLTSTVPTTPGLALRKSTWENKPSANSPEKHL